MDAVKLFTLSEARQIILYSEHTRNASHEWREAYADGKIISMWCECGVKATIEHPTLAEGVQK